MGLHFVKIDGIVSLMPNDRRPFAPGGIFFFTAVTQVRLETSAQKADSVAVHPTSGERIETGMLPTLRRKIEVAISWACGIPFPPNIVQLRLPQRRPLRAAGKPTGAIDEKEVRS